MVAQRAGVDLRLGRRIDLRLTQEHPELYDRIYQVDQTAWRRILESGEAPLLALTEQLPLLAATSDVRLRK